MIYIKNILLLIIFLICSLIGVLLSKKYKNRVKELRYFKEDLNMLVTKIRFTYKPIKDIFEEISKKNNAISKIFEQTNFNLKNNDIKTSWEKALEFSKSKISLNKEDVDIIKGIGNFLRKN